MKPGKTAFVAIFIGAALALAMACSGGGNKGGEAATAKSGSTATATQRPASGVQIAPELKQTPAPSTGTKQGGVLKRLWADPPTLDPHQVSDTTSASIIVEIFSGLVRLNSDLKIEPDLAESYTASPDGKTYEFKLRSGLKFSNGSPLTAADFKWSFQRAAHPRTESSVAELYLGDILGIQEIIDGKGTVTEARGIEVIDERTLRITIDAPKPYFIAKLTYPTAYVLNRQNVESGGNNWTRKPVGTGAFKLEDYRIGERMVLARNEHYWGRKALLDRVEYNLAGGVAMAMYENNEIDITGVGLLDIDRIRDPREPLNKQLVNVPPGFSVSYIGFNTTKPPFDDANFRKALNLAVDKELISTEVYGSLVLPAYGVIPPGFPGYSDDIKGLKFNPDLAKEYLRKSKYASATNRPRIVITVPGTGGSPTLDVEVVTDMWEQTLGVKSEIQQVEWATYLQDLNRRRLQAYAGLGWNADYPDPQDFIDILFYSGSDANHGAYANTAVDRIIEKARTEQDTQKRFALYREAEQMIVDDAAWVPMWFDTQGYALIKPWVKGFSFTPLIVPKLKDVWIDK
ncbi:MAG: peptide ABC transporter substrate-binding protein [SAR202 cluster bacterium]|nr:peptide ABC transporter substrate-binding protein [SAR202 cluster bacterium]